MGGDDILVTRSFEPSNRPPSTVILELIADIKNTKSADIDAVLYDSVDLEALDALISRESEVTISFAIEGYFVTVSDTEVTITLVDFS